MVLNDARLLLLGPIAVAPEHQGHGLAQRLIAGSLARLDALGRVPVVLIGEPRLFGPFGFVQAPEGWTLPGPVEGRRLLFRPGGGAPLPPTGALSAAPPPPRGSA